MKFFTIAILAFTINAFALFSAQGAGLSYCQAGDALSANPTALTDSICPGQSTQLFALPSGGGSNYTFTWTSDPPGFTSSSPDPLVAPLVTTVYTVTVYDGSGTATGNVTVTVKPLPGIDLLPADPKIRILNTSAISACVFDSVVLDAGNPGAVYAWSNGASDQSISIQTSGISFDQQEYEVTVTDPLTGCSNTAAITVQFTFTDCSYGMEENEADRVKLYPNPSPDGLFQCQFNEPGNELTIEVYSSNGSLIKRSVIYTNQRSTHASIVDLRNQTPGVYFLRASNSEVAIFRKLIIRR